MLQEKTASTTRALPRLEASLNSLRQSSVPVMTLLLDNLRHHSNDFEVSPDVLQGIFEAVVAKLENRGNATSPEDCQLSPVLAKVQSPNSCLQVISSTDDLFEALKDLQENSNVIRSRLHQAHGTSLDCEGLWEALRNLDKEIEKIHSATATNERRLTVNTSPLNSSVMTSNPVSPLSMSELSVVASSSGIRR